VVAATRGLDRGRTDQAAVDAAYQQDLVRFTQVQKEAELDFYSDGLLRWQDIFRPLVEGLGERPHTLVRWFDTNTFFRAAELAGDIGRLASPDGVMPDPSLPRPRVLSLPSPYMFSRAVQTRGDRNRLMVELATKVLRPVLEAAVRQGVQLVHLEEPWIAYEGIADSDWGPLSQALEELHEGVGVPIALHLYFGDAGPYVSHLRGLPVDAIGVDMMDTDVAALGSGWPKGLVAGIVNGRDSRVEPVDALVEVARHLVDQVRPRELYLSSNCELAYLPTVTAERKVQALGQAAGRLKELVSV
jgi:methionine synthase II (cobalamin-independent)